MKTVDAVDNIISTSRRQLLHYAILRPESAIVLVVTMLILLLCVLRVYWYPEMWWFWLALGGLTEGLILWTTMTDEKHRSKLSSRLFYQRYSPDQILTPELRQTMSTTLNYHRDIFGEVARRGVTTGLGEIVLEMDNWVVHMFRVVQGIDTFVKNPELIDRLPAVREKTRTPRKPTFETIHDYTTALNDSAAVEKDDARRVLLTQIRTAVLQSKTQADQSLKHVNEFYKQLKVGLPQDQDEELRFIEHVKERMTAQRSILARCGEGMEKLFQFACVAL